MKQDFDRHLRDEYGMDCGNALNDLFQRILRKDAALLTPEAISFPVGRGRRAGPAFGPPRPPSCTTARTRAAGGAGPVASGPG